MESEPVKEKETKGELQRSLTHRPGFLPAILVIVAVALAAFAIFLPFWWATVPLLSLTGIVSWRWHYLLAPLLGFVVGLSFWVGEMALLPSGPLTRLVTAIASVEGLSPDLMRYIGPVLFAVVVAFSATAVGGLRAFHRDVLHRGINDPSRMGDPD